MMNIKTLSDKIRPYSFRGKARLLHSLCSREGERQTEVFGYQMKLDLGDYIQRSIYLGTFEPRESAQVRQYLKPGMTFVDVGANVGYYTLLAASLVGNCGRVLAFEPSPYAFERLVDAITRNNLSQVCAIQSGLSDGSGERRLFLPSELGNHSPSMVPNGGGRPINVSVQQLDDWLAEHDVDCVDLMKIDVEGFEPNVIKGAAKCIQQGKVRAILCEFNKYWLETNGSSSSLLYDLLTSFGFISSQGEPDFEPGVQNLLFTFREQPESTRSSSNQIEGRL
jgi:FkbM family methyltransferase